MNRTEIEWVINPDGTKGFTSNPIRGKCHHNCSWHGVECYAEAIRKRFKKPAEMSWHPEELKAIKRKRKPSTIFVGSTYDIFGEWVSNSYQNFIIKTMEESKQHTFLLLTKNPARYYPFPNLPNCWLGLTFTGDDNDYSKIDYLLDTSNEVNPLYGTFISFEPLLSSISYLEFIRSVDWVIIGSLNQNGRPVPPKRGGTRKEWVLEILKKASEFKTPVFVKSELYKLYPELPYRKSIPYL